MAATEKSKANLIHYKPGQSGNPKGQPKKILSRINIELMKEGFEPANSANVIEAYNILINLTEERIKTIITDPISPMFLRIVAKEMLSKGGPEMIEKMLDRAHGKAMQKQQMDITRLSNITLNIVRGKSNSK